MSHGRQDECSAPWRFSSQEIRDPVPVGRNGARPIAFFALRQVEPFRSTKRGMGTTDGSGSQEAVAGFLPCQQRHFFRLFMIFRKLLNFFECGGASTSKGE